MQQNTLVLVEPPPVLVKASPLFDAFILFQTGTKTGRTEVWEPKTQGWLIFVS